MSDRIKTIFTCEHEREGCPHCAEKIVALQAELTALREFVASMEIYYFPGHQGRYRNGEFSVGLGGFEQEFVISDDEGETVVIGTDALDAWEKLKAHTH